MNSDISKIELKRIYKGLPQLKKLIEEDDSFIESRFYKKMYVSVFDHWLSQQEAENQIYIDENLEELINRRQKLKDFINGVYNQTQLYTWKYKRHYRFHIQKPSSVKDIFRKCDFEHLQSHGGRRYSFLLPDYSAVYAEGWDWTNIIWYKDKQKIEPLIQEAANANLYILE